MVKYFLWQQVKTWKKYFSKKNNEKFEFIFAGDTSFGENYQERIKQTGGESILDRFGYEYGPKKLKPIMKNADFVVMNLETPITDCKQSSFEGQKDYIHWTDKEKAPKTLIEHNVSLVSLAIIIRLITESKAITKHYLYLMNIIYLW